MEERVGKGATAFVVNDRRGEKKEPLPEPAVIGERRVEIEAAKDKSSWLDVSYTVAMIQPQGNPSVILLLRACGERSDGRPFVADWVMPPHWPDTVDIGDWKGYAKARLDTFLDCDCIERNQCSKHQALIAQWMLQDGERWQRTAQSQMPRSMELYLRAEMAKKASGLVVPGR